MPQQIEDINKSNNYVDITLRKLLYFSLVILIFQVTAGYLIYVAFDKWEERSSFGDMFGAIGTLFSGLAFAGVVYAILLQRRDLELQRKEIEMNRKELKRTALAQEKSEQALVEQAKLMELTAKLTSLNFLAEAYKSRIEFLEKKGLDYQQERNKWNEIMRNLEDLSYQIEDVVSHLRLDSSTSSPSGEIDTETKIGTKAD